MQKNRKPIIKVASAIGKHTVTFEKSKQSCAVSKRHKGVDSPESSGKKQPERDAGNIGKKTVSELLRLKGCVYVYFDTDEIAKKFLQDAEAEGFTFGDGVKPTEREPADIFALHKDKTISYVGHTGHIAFGCADKIGDEKLIRIDYRKYISCFQG